MNEAEKEQTEQRLLLAIADYGEWLKLNNYTPRTRRNHLTMLRNFQSYVKTKEIGWEEIFTQKTLQGFRRIYRHRLASTSVCAMARHLYGPIGLGKLKSKVPQKLPQVFEDYLTQFESGGRKVDIFRYKDMRRALYALHNYLNEHEVQLGNLRIEHVDAYLKSKIKKPTTGRFQRSCVRGFLRYLYWDKKLLSRDLAPFVVGRMQFAEAKPPKFLHPEEVERLFTLPTDGSGKQLRRLAMLHLAYTLGLRPVEISLLTLDDIAFQQGEVSLRMRKNFKPIRLPVPEEAIKAIAAYVVGGRPQSAYRQLFLNLDAPHQPVLARTVCREIKQQMKAADLSASPYWLRHTYAQQLLEQGLSIYEIKEMLGHERIQTSGRYLAIHTSLMRKVLFDEKI
jgi:integrase/recombinase XerD